MNTNDASYTQGFNDKLAGVGEHIKNVYNDLKDRMPGDGEPSVPLHAGLGATTGAGIGGMAALAGHAYNEAAAKNVKALVSSVPDLAGKVRPASNAIMSAFGKHPALTTAIPAGILAIIAGIRAHRRQ